MAAWKYYLVVSDPYTRLTKLNRTAQRSPDRYPRVYGAGQSAHNYWRSKSRLFQIKFQIADRDVNHGIHGNVVPNKVAGSAGPSQQWKGGEGEEEEEVGRAHRGLRQCVRRRRWWVQYQRYQSNLKDRNDNLIGDRLELDPDKLNNEEDKEGGDDEWSLTQEGKAYSLLDEDGDADDEAEEEDEEEEDEEEAQRGRKKAKI